MQQELRLMGVVTKDRVNLDWQLIAKCSSPQQAANVCLRFARVPMTQEEVADELAEIRGDMKRATLAAMLSSKKRKRHMPVDLAEDFQDVCGNNAINQWQEMYRKRQLTFQQARSNRKAEILAELAQIEADERRSA